MKVVRFSVLSSWRLAGAAVLVVALVMMALGTHSGVGAAPTSTTTTTLISGETFVSGNVTSCTDLGFPSSDTAFSTGNNTGGDDGVITVTVDGTGNFAFLTITFDSGFTAVVDAVAVKGSNGYNLYKSPSVPPAYSGPFYSPQGGGLGGLSHWFVCYNSKQATTTTTTSTTTTTTVASTTTTTVPGTTTTGGTTTTAATTTTSIAINPTTTSTVGPVMTTIKNSPPTVPTTLPPYHVPSSAPGTGFGGTARSSDNGAVLAASGLLMFAGLLGLGLVQRRRRRA